MGVHSRTTYIAPAFARLPNPKPLLSETRKQDLIYSFSFDIRPAGKVKLAISALCDSDFNPEGLGRVYVNPKVFEIMVCNCESRITGHLQVRAHAGINFCCSESFGPKMVNLSQILENLEMAADDDMITIYHVSGSSKMSFMIGNNPATTFGVELLEPISEFIKLPSIVSDCEAIISTEDMRQMIPLMVQDATPQRVLVSITDSYVTVTVGNKICQYEPRKINGMKGAMPGEGYNGWFQWPHGESLRKASLLTRAFLLCFVRDLLDSFLLRFTVTGYWDLVYVKLKNEFPEAATSKGKLMPVFRVLKEKPTYSFRFQLHPAAALKDALESLTDYSFSTRGGLGLIQVNDNHFCIAVRNSETGVLGLLRLNTTSLFNFRCYKPVEQEMVNLDHIALNVFLANDRDFISVYQVDGSNQISFMSGKTRFRSFAAELLGTNDETKKFSCSFTSACEAVIPTEHLREMIPLMVENRRPQTASLEIKNGFLTISIGQRSWTYGLKAYDKKVLGQNYNVLFTCPHTVSLKWASFLADNFCLHILTEPPGCITFGFPVREFGSLIYLCTSSLPSPTLKGKDCNGA